MTYVIKKIETVNYGEGTWPGCKFGVFRVADGKEEQIGEYERNYGVPYNTFFPFHLNGKDLALSSPDYTATRIMELPSCKDIGGEEPADMGFCPVDYFVPTFIDQEVVTTSTNDAFPDVRTDVRRKNNPPQKVSTEFTDEHEYVNGITGQKCKDTSTYRPLTPLLYYPFGFVAGCIWGDDSSWKVQFLDLSEAEKGILRRDERFGYVSLPDNLGLKDAVDMYDYGYDDEEYSYRIRLNVMQTFDLRTGKEVSPFD